MATPGTGTPIAYLKLGSTRGRIRDRVLKLGKENSHFGVSAVRWDVARTNIIEVMLHRISVDTVGGCNLTGGVTCPIAALAGLRTSGEAVWVVSRNTSGNYELQTRLGGDGADHGVLLNLPTFGDAQSSGAAASTTSNVSSSNWPSTSSQSLIALPGQPGVARTVRRLWR
jgi:hypothetical protein